MSKGRPLSDEERARRRAEDRDRLEQAARALVTSDGWQQWVRVRSRNGLSRYSLRNQLLIALQAPYASFVAGFHAWHELGRTVTKGQRGIRILAPMPLRDRDETATKKTADDGDKVRTLFKSVAVFDVSQTEALPDREPVVLEPPSQPITGDSHADLLVPLTAFAAELDYRVEQRTLPGSAGGWCDAEQRLIVVDASKPGNARVRVLVHELAHALGIGYTELGRERAEVMVDCVTYIVCGQLGLDTATESIPYIAGWAKTEPWTPSRPTPRPSTTSPDASTRRSPRWPTGRHFTRASNTWPPDTADNATRSPVGSGVRSMRPSSPGQTQALREAT